MNNARWVESLRGVDVAPTEYCDPLGNCINTGYQVTDVPGPTTDKFSSPVVTSYGYAGTVDPATGVPTDTPAAYGAAAAKLPGELLKGVTDLLPTVPAWVWLAGGALVFLALHREFKK